MTTLHVHDTTGENCMMLDCPMCDFCETVYYNTKQPKYCSNACKQRAARLRKKKKAERKNVSSAMDTYLQHKGNPKELTLCQCRCGWEIIVSRGQIETVAPPRCVECGELFTPRMMLTW